MESPLRVIGGALRGRVIPYDGDAGLRPMKDRVREAVFNLVGPRVVGKRVLDLFAGTGALSFESLSRKAACAVLFERKFPTVTRIEQTAAELGLSDRVEVVAGDVFIWARREMASTDLPWLVFCSPPYEFFLSRRADLLALVEWLWIAAPSSSVFVIESDERFDPAASLPGGSWDVRPYPPAVIAIAEKSAIAEASGGVPG